MASAVRSTALVVTDKTCQQLHLLPPLFKSPLLADHGQHAPHAGRQFRVLYIEFDIDGELSTMAVVAQEIRAQAFRLSYGAQHRF